MSSINDASMEFPCDQCGSCCRSLAGCELYADLDRGDGICRFLNTNSNLCMIYEQRPNKCNVAKMYSQLYARQCSWKEFVVMNKRSCQILKQLVFRLDGQNK